MTVPNHLDPADVEPPPDPDSPPQNLQAEQSVLGAMMLAELARADVEQVLTGPDFYRPAHELIFDAAMTLHLAGQPVDAVSVAEELSRRGDLARAGGPAYLHTLISQVPTAANAGYYARIVHDKAVLRRLVNAGTRILQLGRTGPGDVDAIVDAAAAEVSAVADARARDDTTVRVADLLDPALDAIEQPIPHDQTGIRWGLYDLDNHPTAKLQPLRPGQLACVGARPSMGKSLFLLTVALSAIEQGKRVLWFSLEMNQDEIMARLISAVARVQLQRVLEHTLTQDDWIRVARYRPLLDDADLRIDDGDTLTLSRFRQAVRRHKPDLVLLDYLGLVDMSGHRGDSARRQAIGEWTRTLKVVARSQQVPILMAAQLNRGPEQRHDRRPSLADLRESGDIEQDCDVVILLHREDYYEPESPRAGEADIIVAKQRNGPRFTRPVTFQGHMSRFRDLAA